MPRTAQIVVIDQSPEGRETIGGALSNIPYVEIIAETDNLIYGYELVRQNRPQMVFIDIRENPHQTLEYVQKISTYFKDTLIVVSGQVVSLETIIECMQSGAREYLRRPLSTVDIVGVVEKHRKALIVDSQGDTTGRIITIFSNKGGLGKTTISVNLAMALSQAVQKPVVLVDLNFNMGDISTFMGLTPKQTISDIAMNIGRVDASYLNSSLSEYSYLDAKVKVLADPNLMEGDEISAEQVNTVLTILKSTYEYVIVDTNSSIDSRSLAALDLSDNILLVSMFNISIIRSTLRVLALFDKLGYPDERIKIVINRFVNDGEITVEDVEDTLKHPIFWTIPNNYQTVMAAINHGEPILKIENNGPLSKNFLELACKLSGVVPKKLEAPPAQDGKKQPKNALSEASGPKAQEPPKERKSLLGGL
ncbi:MAG: AAA family ATPase, partial [Cyanobacteria bacterium]|nr:AAA family ATPase [Cyanobacteriota bacterium]